MESATAYQPTSATSSLLRELADLIEPPPRRTADLWADEKRILPKGGPEPGPWRTSRMPWTRDIMRAFSDPYTGTIVVCCGRQMAKTEMIINLLGHRHDEGPRVPSLYIGPTQKQVTSISKDRFRKAIRDVPSWFAKLEGGHRDSTYEKFFLNVRAGFGWAGSASELATHPVGLLLVDELDRFASDVGGEGDPLSVVEGGTRNFFGAKIGVFSTPLIEGASATWAMLDEGSLDFWSWACLHCSDLFVPHLALLRWPKKATPQEAHDNALLACPNCGGEHRTPHRAELNRNAVFVRHRKLDDAQQGAVLGQYVVDDDPQPTRTRSYWVSGIASPFRSFGVMAERMVRALRSRNQSRIQGVVNTEFGEPFRVEGEAPAWELVWALRRDYPPSVLPPECQIISAGVDVQKRGLYYVVVGWGYNMGSWLIENGFLVGESEFDEVWLQLARVLNQRYGDMPIARAFVDSGYRPGDRWRRPENAVYKFCHRHKPQVYATKGHAVLEAPYKAKEINVTLQGRLLKNGLQLWHLNTDYLKSTIYTRLKWPEAEPGEWVLHRDADLDLCKQLVSEQVLPSSSGKRTWIIRGENHYLDCYVNALAAGMSLGVERLPTWQRAQDELRASEEAVQAAPAGGFIRRPEGSFFRR